MRTSYLAFFLRLPVERAKFSSAALILLLLGSERLTGSDDNCCFSSCLAALVFAISFNCQKRKMMFCYFMSRRRLQTLPLSTTVVNIGMPLAVTQAEFKLKNTSKIYKGIVCFVSIDTGHNEKLYVKSI